MHRKFQCSLQTGTWYYLDCPVCGHMSVHADLLRTLIAADMYSLSAVIVFIVRSFYKIKFKWCCLFSTDFLYTKFKRKALFFFAYSSFDLFRAVLDFQIKCQQFKVLVGSLSLWQEMLSMAVFTREWRQLTIACKEPISTGWDTNTLKISDHWNVTVILLKLSSIQENNTPNTTGGTAGETL